MAAARGANVVLVGRSEDALSELEFEIKGRGGKAISVGADVGNMDEVEQVSYRAQEAFGGFDTWVNNSGVSIYGKLRDVSESDSRRLFETNFWGVVHGSIVALRQFEKTGGSIINIGSVLSETVVPLQAMYSASKHAVKAFTDGLRMEIEADRLPISVTLIKPAAIDTPYPQHAKNYLTEEPTNPPPLYAPDVVARAILRCAQSPQAEVTVGGAGKLMTLAGKFTPRLRDILFEGVMIPAQHSGRPVNRGRASGLDEATNDLRERGGDSSFVLGSSTYTAAAMHPVVSGLVLLGGGLALASLLRGNGSKTEPIAERVNIEEPRLL
jgi:short-subunit dehydrogenase